jgi:methionine aminotransferase
MAQTPFKCIPSHGSYFECYSYADISDEPDTEFAKRMTIDYGVATIPVSAFYQDSKDDKVVRFCFAKKEITLDMAIEKLKLL